MITVAQLNDLAAKKAALENQISTLNTQIEQHTASLVQKYGADWEVKYNEALLKLQEWENANNKTGA